MTRKRLHNRFLIVDDMMGGEFRAYRNMSFYHSNIVTYTATYASQMDTIIDEAGEYGEFTLEQFDELAGTSEPEQDELATACYNVMAAHGIAVYYDITTRMVQDRFPELQATESRVLFVLSRRTVLFEKHDVGVYWLAGKPEGKTYPEM